MMLNSGRGVIGSLGYVLSILYFVLIYFSYINPLCQVLVTCDLYVLFLLMLVYTLMKGKVYYNAYNKHYFLFILVIFLFSVLPYVGSAYAGNVLSATVNMITLLLLTYCLSVFIKPTDLRIFPYVISCSSILLFICTVNQFDIYAGERFGNDLAGNANIISPLYMIAAISSVYCIFRDKNWLAKILFLLFYGMQIYAIVLTGTKKALIISILFFAFYFILTRKRKVYIVASLLVSVVLVFIAYMALFNVPVLYDLIGYRFEGMIAAFTTNQGDASTMERMSMVHDALNLWTSRPLTGIGLNLFAEKSVYGTYSHNNYVELLSTTGLIGFVFYYLIYVSILGRLRAGGSRLDTIFCFLFVCCLFLFDLGAVTYNYSLIQICLSLCGIYCSGLQWRREFH